MAKATRTKSYDFVTVTALTDAGLNIGDTLRFHAFNPNGLAKEQHRINAALMALVEAGVVKSGALIAYGGLDSYNNDRLFDMLEKKPSAIEASVMVRMYTERNAKARAFVVDNGGVVAPVVQETVEAVRARREATMQSLLNRSEG